MMRVDLRGTGFFGRTASVGTKGSCDTIVPSPTYITHIGSPSKWFLYLQISV